MLLMRDEGSTSKGTPTNRWDKDGYREDDKKAMKFKSCSRLETFSATSTALYSSRFLRTAARLVMILSALVVGSSSAKST